jgi:integration host factor subunit beta
MLNKVWLTLIHWRVVAVTKSELIERMLRRFPYLGQKGAETLVNTVFSEMANALAEGTRVELRRFGSFSIRTLQPGVARNPKNGEHITVAARRRLYFRAGKPLCTRLNQET